MTGRPDQPLVPVRRPLEAEAVAKGAGAALLLAALIALRDPGESLIAYVLVGAVVVACAVHHAESRGGVPRGDVPLLPAGAHVEPAPRPVRWHALAWTGAMLVIGFGAAEVFGTDSAMCFAAVGLGLAASSAVTAARVRAWERRHGVELIASEGGDGDDRRFGRPVLT